MQPRLSALLPHNPVRSPGRQRVVESFIGRPNRLFVRIAQPRVVEASQVTHSIICGRWHHPRVASVRKWLRKSAVILKNIYRMRAQRFVCGIPINRRIRKADVKIRNHRLSVDRHISRRCKVGLFHVLQVGHKRLLRRTPGARIPLDRSLIDHDRECEPRMAFCRRHYQLCGLIDGISRPVPVDNHAVNSAAHHIVNLALHLRRIGLAIADVHVVRLPEPQNHVRINFSRRARIKQGVNINLADISRASIVIGLRRKAVCRAGVVGSLSRQGCGGYDVRGTCRTQSRRKQSNSKYQSETHGSSGRTVEPRILLRIWDQLREGTPAYEFPRDWDRTGLSGNCGQLRWSY